MTHIVDHAHPDSRDSSEIVVANSDDYRGTIAGLLDLGGIRCVAAGADLYASGDPASLVHVVVSGWFVVYAILEDGRRQNLNFAMPGAILGLEHDGARMMFGAQALTGASVIAIPRARFEARLARDPDLRERVHAQIMRDKTIAFERMTSLGRHTASERVAHLLLELFCRARGRRPVGREKEIDVPVTQQVIADTVGLTAVHVNRTLRRLREAGIAGLCSGKLAITDGRRLAALACAAEGIAGMWTGAAVHKPATTGPAIRPPRDAAVRPSPRPSPVAPALSASSPR